MSASDKPTIEGFVDRLLEENHIKSNETATVANTLKKFNFAVFFSII